MRLDRSREFAERAHASIPGGAHTYAKGDDQYPLEAPGFIERGEGCRVWDVDGNAFVEYGLGLRAVTLGHAFPPVVAAVRRELERGSNFTRPAAIEVEAAERLLRLLPAADMVKFAKNGSDVTTAAVKLARACTGRDLVAVCADQPFFSTDDWFIGTTAMPAGIPEAVRRLTVRFRYNDLESLEALFEERRGEIACVMLEPASSLLPEPGFLEGVRRICSREGALLVFDEMITGFRWSLGGAQAYYGVEPDLSTFGKGLANGFAVSALLGKRAFMERGGLRHGEERVFLLSTTHGAETHALAAAIATIDVFEREDVVAHLWRQGDRLARGVRQAAEAAGVWGAFGLAGVSPNLVFVTRDPEGRPSQAYRTLFLQEMIARGFITPSFVVSYSHDDETIDRTIEAVAAALAVYRRAIDDGVDRHLRGRPVQPVFRRTV